MMRRTWLAGLLLALFSGCLHDRVYTCADDCAGGRFSGRFDAVGGLACGSCGGDPTAGCCDYTLKARIKHQLTCGSGCGEIYWDEWLNDPPDHCNPCDQGGNWIGPRPYVPHWLDTGWTSLWGFRSDHQGCSSGCSSGCAATYEPVEGSVMLEAGRPAVPSRSQPQ